MVKMCSKHMIQGKIMATFIKVKGCFESERINFDLVTDYNRNKNCLFFFYINEDDDNCNYLEFRTEKKAKTELKRIDSILLNTFPLK